MRSPTRWVVEIILVAVGLLVLGIAVAHGLDSIAGGGKPSRLEQVLVTLYVLLVGLVVEVVRWSREILGQAAEKSLRVLEEQLADSAEKAVRGAVLRAIFPSGTADQPTARLHFAIVEDYLRQVEQWAPLIQRASGVLASRHITAWRGEMDLLVGGTGVPLKMDESARMSSVMLEDATSYLTIERTPCDPEETWSPGFLKVMDDLGRREDVRKTFILLADARAFADATSTSANSQSLREVLLHEEAFLRRRGFRVFFCDERAVHKELGTTDIPSDNFEVFSDKVVLQMCPAQTYDRKLSVVLRPLPAIGELRRFIQIVEAQTRPMTSRNIKNGQI